MKPTRFVQPVSYHVQRGALDAQHVWFCAFRGTPEKPQAGSGYIVLYFDIGDESEVCHWLSLN